MNAILKDVNYISKSEVFSIDWLHGMSKQSNCYEFLYDLECIDSRLSIDNFVKWRSGYKALHSRYQLNDMPGVMIAFTPMIDDNPDYSVGNRQVIEDFKSFIIKNPKCNYDKYFNFIASIQSQYCPGFFFQLTGDGLRYLGNETVNKIIQLLMSKYNFKPSRLDLACDFYNPFNDIVPTIIEAFKHDNGNLEKGKPCLQINSGRSVQPYFNYCDIERKFTVPSGYSYGNRSSKVGYCRLYDKFNEISTGRLSDYSEQLLSHCPDNYWWRLEFELHENRATEILFNIACNISIESCFKKFAKEFLNIKKGGFLAKVINYTDLNNFPIWSEWTDIRTIHFVQLEQQNSVYLPFVGRYHSIRKSIKRLSKFLYACLQHPDFWDTVQSEGQERYLNDSSYNEYRDSVLTVSQY